MLLALLLLLLLLLLALRLPLMHSLISSAPPQRRSTGCRIRSSAMAIRYTPFHDPSSIATAHTHWHAQRGSSAWASGQLKSAVNQWLVSTSSSTGGMRVAALEATRVDPPPPCGVYVGGSISPLSISPLSISLLVAPSLLPPLLPPLLPLLLILLSLSQCRISGCNSGSVCSS
jgi:hypothetical protein